ncbi:MAG: RHS repeat-associated core domain-containing protein, partial [Micromonosporaceae bacterium]
NNHVWNATYDAAGNRTSATDPLGRKTTWTYNANNYLKTMTDPRGNAPGATASFYTTTYDYDDAPGVADGCSCRLLRQSRPLLNAAGTAVEATQVVQYRYGERGGNNGRGDLTTVVDPLDKEWTSDYDADGNPVKVTDPLGHRTTATFDRWGRRTSEVSPRGNLGPAPDAGFSTAFDHDADNRLRTTSTANPPGAALTSSRTWDANRNLRTATDGNGNETTYDYDAANQLRSVRRADASRHENDYWDDGSLKARRDGAGNATTYFYDAQGRLTTTKDPLGRATSYGYDPAGNQLSEQDPGGDCSASPKLGCTTYGYDIADQLKTITYSDAATPDVTDVVYDAHGPRTAMTEVTKGAAPVTSTSTWTWDSLNRLVQSKDVAGATVDYAYDLRGQLRDITYPGAATPLQRGFDDAGRMEWVEDWLGNRTTFGYDENDNVTTRTLPAGTGVVDTYTYDNADRLRDVALRKDAAPFAGFGYQRDGAGQVTSATATGVPPDDHTYGYSSLNQLCWVAGAGQNGTCATPPADAARYGYDDADNPTTFAGASRAFNTGNELCWSVAGDAAGACGAPPPGATTFAYDARGNRTEATPAAGEASTYAYDQANRLTSAQAHPAAPASPSGMLRVTTVPAVPSQIVVDGVPRDTWGLTWANIEPGPHTVCFRDVVGYTTPDCQTVSVEAGSVTTVAGTFLQRGTLKVATSPAVPGTVTVDGEPRNDWGMWTDLPAERTYRVCFGAVADHAPPPCQDVVLAPGAVREVTGTYTPSPGAAGPSGHGYLRVTTNPAVASQIVVDGVPRDSWGLTWVKFAPGEHTVCFTDIDGYTTPACQSIEVTAGATTEVQGRFVQRGVIKVETSPPVPATITIDGIARNNWAVWTDLPAGGYQVCFGQVPAHVAPPCRYVTLTPGATTTVTGTYDTPTTYAYNGDGLRMSRSTAGATTSFTWDLAQGLPLPLSEGTAGSVTRYIYGPGNLPLAEVSPSGRILYHHHDQLGSTRALTDAVGSVVATATYDAYGSLASSTGLARTSFGFAGEYTDAETGFVYLRARYYDPGTGQFLTRDPLSEITGEPYAYASNDPVNVTDPTGMCPWCIPIAIGILVGGGIELGTQMYG